MGILAKVFGLFVGLVAIVALFTQDARETAEVAGRGGSTFGITAGSLAAAIPNAVEGFEQARKAKVPDPFSRQNPANASNRQQRGGNR